MTNFVTLQVKIKLAHGRTKVYDVSVSLDQKVSDFKKTVFELTGN